MTDSGNAHSRADALGEQSTVDRLERDTQRRGRALFADVRRQERRRGPSELLYSWIMSLTTADERLKVELFRFVDALPSLKNPDAVSAHLAEYLLQPGVRLPPGAGALLVNLRRYGPTRALLASACETGARMMARRFIAGLDAREATAAVRDLRRRHMGFTLDLLGEAVTSEAEAHAYQKQYLDLIGDLSQTALGWTADAQTDDAPFGPIPRVNVSVKLSSLYARFDPMAADATADAVKARLRPILTLARQRGVFVNFDREQHDFCEITQRIFCEILDEDEHRDSQDVGIVVQAYLRRAETDLRALHAWAQKRGAPVWVRLVKGAYWDYETIIAAQRGNPVPVYAHKSETDACFERCATYLIEHWQTLRPAIATHNIRSAAHAQAVAASLALPRRTVEFQALYGMGDSIARALAGQGERVRVYTPFGRLLPGMAYLVRRLLENTSNDSLVRSSGGSGDTAALLEKPVTPALSDPGPASSGFRNLPETDFALAGSQAEMAAALDRVRGALGATVPIIMDGKHETSERVFVRADPSDTARIVSRVNFATQEQATRAVDAASRSFPAWRDTPVVDRANLLRRTADWFEKRKFEIAAWQVYEAGKPWRDAEGDVAEAIDFCRYYADEIERLSAGRRRNIPGEWNEYVYDARGPAVIIAPWNFPLAILTGMAVAALVAGNTVVLKPSEQTSRVGLFLQEALEAAGIPPGVSNFLPGDGEEIGPTLVEDPRVALIAFTGSRAVGLGIIEIAAVVRPGQREIKRVIAEMGGKNAIIVDEDADLDEAVGGILASAVGFAGQKCSACSRVIVIGSAYDSFCARMADAVRSIRIGPADDPATTLGPVVDSDSRDRVLRYTRLGREEGRLLAECTPTPTLAESGWYVPVSIFTDCPKDGKLWSEEIFGPVLAVVKAPDMTEALRMADDSLYALTGGLYSRSPRNIQRVRREFRVGNLYINRKITGAMVDRQPFGGARLSGVGSKAGGPDYLLQFLVPRTITESVMRRGFAPTADVSGGGV